MKLNKKNIVKIAAPVFTLLVILYVLIFAKDNGDPEFGAIGENTIILLILFASILLYFIAGIIIWIATKKNYIFLSAFFSLLVILTFILLEK